MDVAFRSALAEQWQRILRLDPDTIFREERGKLLQRNWGDRLAQPGYVGMGYSPGGIAFVSMNPGAGDQEGLSPYDLQQYALLQALRDAPEGQRVEKFNELTTTLAEVMPIWRIFKVFVSPVLTSTRVGFESVAYLNLLKWRTSQSNSLQKLYAKSWTSHVADQFRLLRPSKVVAIGVDAGKAFRELYTYKIAIEVIPRVIGNNIGVPGREALARIDTWFNAAES
jgi:hypothetical protein